MKKVSVQFNQAGKWAISIEEQIAVAEGEVVSGLPVGFAHIVVDAGRGQIVDDPEEFFDETPDDPDESAPHSYSGLYNLNMKDLRTVGDEFEVKDNKKDDLINKVLAAQLYTQDYLDNLEDDDVVAVAVSKGMTAPPEEVDMPDVVAFILESQEKDED